MREAAFFIASRSDGGIRTPLASIVDGVRNAYASWANRRRLTHLADLDDHVLSDIGLTRDDVSFALELPFATDAGLELQRRALRNTRYRWRGAC